MSAVDLSACAAQTNQLAPSDQAQVMVSVPVDLWNLHGQLFDSAENAAVVDDIRKMNGIISKIRSYSKINSPG